MLRPIIPGLVIPLNVRSNTLKGAELESFYFYFIKKIQIRQWLSDTVLKFVIVNGIMYLLYNLVIV